MHVSARSTLAVVTVAVLVVTAGCGGSDRHAQRQDAVAEVVIDPVNGAADVRPDKPVVVRAARGRLDKVVLYSGGRQIAGDFNQDHTQWQSKWGLKPGAVAGVLASATNADGKTVSATSRFTTRKAPHLFTVSQDFILEARRGDTYGIGLPIILNFDRPITDRAAVERALEVTAEKPVEGAWHWFGDKQVVYRPRTFWPAHQTVTLNAHLTGVRGAPGVYGKTDFTRTYKIGPAQIAYLDIKRDKMRVFWDYKLKRRIPISAGMGGTREYTTTSGIHLNMEKDESVWMTSPGRGPGDPGYYHELIHYAVRVSNAGEYLHQTPGAEDCLGNRNCSHGCIRQPAADAIWYYKHAQPADPVIITGTDRQVEPDNGWSYYQMPWPEWLKGSALQR